MSDPSLPLQQALVTQIKAAAGLMSLIGSRVYDAVPDKAQFPYLSLGDMQVLPDKADCIDGTEVSVQIDAWSQANGYPEVKRIGAAVVAALDDQSIAVDGYTAVVFEIESVHYLRDPDGITRHGVLTFRALIQAS